jgi:hypothetical protein
MPIKNDITVYPSDEIKQCKFGWIVMQDDGMGILNPNAVAMLQKNS